MHPISWKITTEGKPQVKLSWLKWIFIIVVLFLVMTVKIDRKDPFYSRTITVEDYSGEVLYRRDMGSWMPVTRDYFMQDGDSLRVIDGSAFVRIWNGSLLHLTDNSWIKLSDISSSSWIDRSLVVELVIGDVYFDIADFINGSSGIAVHVDNKILQANAARFAVSLSELGELSVYSHDSYISLGDTVIQPGTLLGPETSPFIDSLDVLFFDLSSRIHSFVSSRIDKTIRIREGDLLHPAKRLWSSFVQTLLVNESHVRSYKYAYMEELWMEAIALSLEGKYQEAHLAVSRAQSVTFSIKHAESFEPDAYKYLFEISERLQKIYELSSLFPGSVFVSGILLDEISQIRVQDSELIAAAYFRRIESMYGMDFHSSLYRQYVIDLAHMMELFWSSQNQTIQSLLVDRFILFANAYESDVPGLAKLRSRFFSE